MPVDWTQTVSTLAATVVGGGITVAVTELSHRRQQRAAISAEIRAREIKASDRAMEALTGLIELERDRSEVITSDTREILDDAGYAAWKHRQVSLTHLFQMACADFTDPALRHRLLDAGRIIRNPQVVSSVALFPHDEAVRDVVLCIGAFRRGDPVPEPEERYREILANFRQRVRTRGV
jgi:hypothetical protein